MSDYVLVPKEPTPEMIEAGWASATDENAALVHASFHAYPIDTHRYLLQCLTHRGSRPAEMGDQTWTPPSPS